MSDININGIMNMGFLGGGGGTFGGDAATGTPAMSANEINASMGWNPNAVPFNPWANSGGGFGTMTDYYSALGADYGRATGGFGGGGGGGGGNNLPGYYPAGDVTSSPLLPLDYNDSAGLGSAPAPEAPTYQDPFTGAAGNGGGMSSVFDPGGYAQMYRMPDANPDYFNPGAYGGDQGSFGVPYQGAPIAGDIGFSRSNPMPNLGYNPAMQNWFANPDMGGGNQFGNRFGQWGPNAGTPSQYTSAPYTDTGGQTFAPNLPPGYAPAFNADQPGGALPLGSLFDNLPGGG